MKSFTVLGPLSKIKIALLVPYKKKSLGGPAIAGRSYPLEGGKSPPIR